MIAAVAALCVAFPQAQTLDLRDLVGKTLNMDEGEHWRALNRFIQNSFPDSIKPMTALGVKCSYVWMNGDKLVVFQEFQTRINPGTNKAQVSIFDNSQTPIGCSQFQVGHRSIIDYTAVVPINGIKGLTLCMTVNGQREGENRLYFGFDGDRIALLRVEDGKGNIAPQEFEPSHRNYGPDIPHYEKASLLRVLRGKERLRKLELLTWFAGEHGGSYVSSYRPKDKPLPSVIRYWPLEVDEEVCKEIAKLRTEKDAWIAQAAKSFVQNNPFY